MVSFYILSSAKFVEQESQQVLPRGESWHQWEGKVSRKGGRRVNKVHKMCTFVCKSKHDTS
jgi:hypothetical protein